LGEHLLSGTADAVDMFCQMENADRQLVWAKFDRADWELARQHLLAHKTQALGIRQQHCFQHGAVLKPLFVRGPITITHGDWTSGVIQWSSVTPNRYNQMNRPGSFEVSGDLARRKSKALLNCETGSYTHDLPHCDDQPRWLAGSVLAFSV
jgi:hypothetical protein